MQVRSGPRRRRVLRAAALVLLTGWPVLSARDGDLDSSFATAGILCETRGIGWDIAAHPSGRVLLAGKGFNFTAACYTREGVPDPAFAGGVADIDLPGSGEEPYAMALQPDGRVLLGGFCDGIRQDFALVRLRMDGLPDPEFGGDGIVTMDLAGQVDAIRSLWVQPDGAILAAGTAGTTLPWNVALARYRTDGGLDSTFGTDGIVITELSAYSDAWEVRGDPAGRILVCGWVHNTASGLTEAILLRYRSDGVPDPDFGDAGLVRLRPADPPAGDCEARALALQGDGRIIVAGIAHTRIFVAAVDGAGVPDPAFGPDGTGWLLYDVDVGADVANALAVDGAGRILIAGHGDDPASGKRDAHLARVTAEGRIDSSFATNGIARVNFFREGSYTSDDFCYGMAIQSDGRVLIGGRAGVYGEYRFAAARFMADSPPVAVPATAAPAPPTFVLDLPAPNPFNPVTRLGFTLSRSGPVRLSVVDLLGREVVVLIDGILSGGLHERRWGGTDGRGRNVPGGIYFCRLRTEEGTAVRRLVLVR